MLNLQVFESIEEIPVAVDAFLEEDAVASNIALGILKQMRRDPLSFQNYHVFVLEDGRGIQAYAHHVSPFPLILGRGTEAAAQSLADSLRQSRHAVSKVQGPSNLVESFAQGWPELFQADSRWEKQGLYKLERVIFPQPSGARFEQARLEDLAQLVAWHRAFCQESGDILLSDEAITELQTKRIQAGDLFVLRHGTQTVSMATATRTVGRGRTLSFVYTPPELRGKGYASELTAWASDHILRSGFDFCCLFTQMNNPTSNRIYQNVGYEWVKEFLMVTCSVPAEA